jgi:4-amino-4-deoxy-L-arabinose transferase-like glycosyltransferase
MPKPRKKIFWQVLPTWFKFFWVVIIFVFLFRAFFLENIANKALYDFDEARYAEVAKNIIKTGNWLVPLSGGPDEPRQIPFLTLDNGNNLYPYFWKPPLHTWAISLGYKLIGINELAVRLPSLFSGLGILILTFLLARKLFPKQKQIAYVATLILVSLNDFSFLVSYGNSDSLLLFLVLLSLYFALCKSNRAAILAGLFLGLAFLIKSVAIFWLPLVILISWLYLKFKNYQKKGLIIALSALVVALPWLVFMYFKFGNLFWERFFLANTIERLQGLSGNQAPVYWYLIYIVHFWQGLVLYFVMLSFLIVKSLWQRKYEYWYLLAWLMIIFIPFSLMSSKVWWYILPMLIPVSLLSGKVFVDFIPSGKLIIAKYLLLALVIILNLHFSVKEANKRTNHNLSLKILAGRHQNMNSLSAYKIPYEAPLFYFNTGTVSRNDLRAKHLITKKEFLISIDKQYKVIDYQGDYYLLTR